jgi:hypothetical protein
MHFFFFFQMISCCLLKLKHSVLNYYTKQNPIHRAIQPYKNIWSGPYNQKVSRGSEIITNFGTQCSQIKFSLPLISSCLASFLLFLPFSRTLSCFLYFSHSRIWSTNYLVLVLDGISIYTGIISCY